MHPNEVRMIGTRRVDRDAFSYTPFPVPPHNQAEAARIRLPIAHIDSSELGLMGYSIDSRDAVPTMVEAMYFPVDYVAMSHPASSTIRTWLRTSVAAGEAVNLPVRPELLAHAADYIHNTHESWTEMNGRAGFERESEELRRALSDARPYVVSITFDGQPRDALAIEHLGRWFAQTTLRYASTLVTLAGTPDLRQNEFAARLVQRPGL